MKSRVWTKEEVDRRQFIGGSDARIIMGDDGAALLRLWREKRGEAEPEDLSGNLIVQLAVSPRSSTGSGMSAIPARWSARSNGGFSTPSSDGWRRRWTAWSRAPERSLRP